MKVHRPFQGNSASGKNGRSQTAFIMQRTGADCSIEEQVTVVKGYRKPTNPNTALQQAQRTFFGTIMRAGKALKDAVKKG